MPVRLGRGPVSLLLDRNLKKKTIYHQKASLIKFPHQVIVIFLKQIYSLIWHVSFSFLHLIKICKIVEV